MLVLVVDTAGSAGGVLLARAGAAPHAAGIEILGEAILEPRKFSSQLVSSITELLESNRLDLSSLDAFAVISGPGSFTGLRVGLSAVKAMAEVMAKPVIAVSRLAVMAAAVSNSEFVGETVHAVLDAGRGEFYHGIYRDTGRVCVAESLETSAALAASIETIPGTVVTAEPSVLASLHSLPGVILLQIPLEILHEALPLVLAAWQARSFSDVARLDANYLHRVDPKIAKTVSVSESPDARKRR